MIKKGLFWFTTSFLYLISLLPFRVIYLLSDILFLILYYVISYRKNVVRDNLANAFPEKTPEARKKIAVKYYRFLSDMILESVKMISISQESLQKRFRFNNMEEISDYFPKGRSVIAVTGHYGNWELGALATPLTLREPALIVYKPLADKRFEEFINKMRSRFGCIMVAMKQTLRKVAEFRNRRYVLVLLGDQTPSGAEIEYFTTFLNQPTFVFLGIEKIAKSTGNPIVYFTIRPYKRGYYECDLKTLVENPESTREYEITELHIRELENVIREKPEYWLWSHRRWKFKPEMKNE